MGKVIIVQKLISRFININKQQMTLQEQKLGMYQKSLIQLDNDQLIKQIQKGKQPILLMINNL